MKRKLFLLLMCLWASNLIFGALFTPIQGYVDAVKEVPDGAAYYRRNAANKGQVVYAIWYDRESALRPQNGIASQIVIQNSKPLDSLRDMSSDDWLECKTAFRNVLANELNATGLQKRMDNDTHVTFDKEEQSQIFETKDFVAVTKVVDMGYSACGMSGKVRSVIVTGVANVNGRAFTIMIMNRETNGRTLAESKALFEQCVKHMVNSVSSTLITKCDVSELNYGKHDLRWTSAGNEKSEGIEVQLDMPSAMTKEKVFQPHTLTRYSANIPNRDVCVQIFCAVHPLPKSVETIIKAQSGTERIELDKKEVSELIPKSSGISLVTAHLIRTAGVPAMEMMVKGNMMQAGHHVSLCQKIYVFSATNGRSLHVVFCVSSLAGEISEHEMKLVEPMCRRVLNSLTLLKPSQFNVNTMVSRRGGTAWFVASNLLVTCAHVIGDSEDIYFNTQEGMRIPCRVVAKDVFADLAVLKTDVSFSKWLHIGNDVNLADEVFTLGYPNPEIMGTAIKYTTGVVSASSGLHGDQSTFQLTVPMQPGNSGGPILDSQGNVVGVASSRLESAIVETLTDREAQNVNFAVKGSALKQFLDRCGIKYCGIDTMGESSFNRARLAQSAAASIMLLHVE